MRCCLSHCFDGNCTQQHDKPTGMCANVILPVDLSFVHPRDCLNYEIHNFQTSPISQQKQCISCNVFDFKWALCFIEELKCSYCQKLSPFSLCKYCQHTIFEKLPLHYVNLFLPYFLCWVLAGIHFIIWKFSIRGIFLIKVKFCHQQYMKVVEKNCRPCNI